MLIENVVCLAVNVRVWFICCSLHFIGISLGSDEVDTCPHLDSWLMVVYGRVMLDSHRPLRIDSSFSLNVHSTNEWNWLDLDCENINALHRTHIWNCLQWLSTTSYLREWLTSDSLRLEIVSIFTSVLCIAHTDFLQLNQKQKIRNSVGSMIVVDISTSQNVTNCKFWFWFRLRTNRKQLRARWTSLHLTSDL